MPWPGSGQQTELNTQEINRDFHICHCAKKRKNSCPYKGVRGLAVVPEGLKNVDIDNDDD